MSLVEVFFYFVVWVVTGYALFFVTVYLDPDSAELIQENETIMVILILLWPLLVWGLLKFSYIQLKQRWSD